MTREPKQIVSKRKERTPRVPVTIRIPKDLVKKIDLELAHRSVPVSRNNWLLEAAIEKLNGNGSRGSNGKE